MKHLKRLMALLLAALLLTGAALAEAPEVASESVEPAAESVEMTLGPSVQPKDSSLDPEYSPQQYSAELTDDRRGTFNIGDMLIVYPTEGYIVSCVSSDPDAVFVKICMPSTVQIYMQDSGTANLLFTIDNGKKITLEITVLDPTVPTGIAMDQRSYTLRVGSDLNVPDHIVITPAWAVTGYKIKSSSKKVALVDADGLLTARKPGKTTVTVTTDNKLKVKFTVHVKANRADDLAKTPGKANAAAVGNGWTLWPKAVEMTADGGAVLDAYVLNGTAQRLTELHNLDLAVISRSEAGDEVLARSSFSNVRVSCGKKSVKKVKLTFPAEDVVIPNADLTANPVSVVLHSAPSATFKKAEADYIPSPYIPSEVDPELENPVVYRALLVSEDQFYWGSKPGDASKWEHDLRNKGDVSLLADMLARVSAPNGSKYIVTTQNSTTKQQLLDLIANTFAEADANDVSLFFIATHGVDEVGAADEEAGALGMSSLTDQYPELMNISELRDCLLRVPGKVIVLLQSCGSGAAIYQKGGAVDIDAAARACAAFDAAVVEAFRSADPGIPEPADVVSKTGELRMTNKFYVLTGSAFEEPCFGQENPKRELNNYFTSWLWSGVGIGSDQPADVLYAGNCNGVVDLHELYRYMAARAKDAPVYLDDGCHHQHIQVYPADTRFPMFQ